MSRSSCNFIVKGDRTFIHEFEKMLEENKITHSEPQLEKPVVETHEGVEREREVENEMMFREHWSYFLTSRETIGFVIAITPIALDIIRKWYASRKKKGEKGEIQIRTSKGTVEISAESIKKFVYTEGTTKRKRRKKAIRAKNKQVRNLKSKRQQKTN